MGELGPHIYNGTYQTSPFAGRVRVSSSSRVLQVPDVDRGRSGGGRGFVPVYFNYDLGEVIVVLVHIYLCCVCG